MRAILLLLVCGVLTACSGSRNLHDMRSGTAGPDDFSALPVAPLTIPETLALPTPTPGAPNLVDRDPQADAIAALGGNPARASAGGLPAADAGLVAYARRNGSQADIRAILAQEDAAFRARRSRLGLFSFLRQDRYFRAYRRQALDAYAELERFRELGVATPTAPPGN